MRHKIVMLAAGLGIAVLSVASSLAGDAPFRFGQNVVKPRPGVEIQNVQVGVRPYFLVEQMEDGPLKEKLRQCANRPFYKTDFSIGHRGACLQFPEHTKESYVAAARQGAGIVECDVTFTSDRQLVCRHSQCDLHTTTNILAIPDLAAKCTQPFVPADPATGRRASALCCTSDITLAEFKTLCGKMDASNPNATTVAEYLGGTANFRTDLYSQCGTVLTHKESIALFKELGVKFTPELKTPSVAMPYEGEYTQEMYAQQMIDEYKQAGVPAKDVWAQSFYFPDILYWIANEPAFAKQAVWLDARWDDGPGGFDENDPATWTPTMDELVAQGVKIVAPPMQVLLRLDANGKVIPSEYARAARAAGLDIITWTFERSGILKPNTPTYYYATITGGIDGDGDALVVLDVLAKDVGVIGIFSDWPGTVTYYANCMGL